jgi:hypothetical protein
MTVTAQRLHLLAFQTPCCTSSLSKPDSKPDSLLAAAACSDSKYSKQCCQAHTRTQGAVTGCAIDSSPAPPLKKAPTPPRHVERPNQSFQREAAHALTGAQTHSTHAVLVCVTVESTDCGPSGKHLGLLLLLNPRPARKHSCCWYHIQLQKTRSMHRQAWACVPMHGMQLVLVCLSCCCPGATSCQPAAHASYQG